MNDTSMKCPHCLVSFNATRYYQDLNTDTDGYWRTEHVRCPACSRLIVWLVDSAGPRLVSSGTGY